MSVPGKLTWGFFAESVRGFSHAKQGKPNQDSIFFAQSEDYSSGVLAIADGHGSPRSIRSGLGSRRAVTIATRIVTEFLEANRTTPLTALKSLAIPHLPVSLVRHWHAEVDKLARAEPFTTEEVAEIVGIGQALETAAGLRVAYGSTLIIAAVCENYFLLLQLGDGDVLVVMDDGTVEMPMPFDPALIANETHSLCQSDAHRKFKAQLRFFGKCPPAMILVSTDGYSNSFASVDDFKKVGMDLLDLLKTSGVAAIQAALPDWLNTSSAPPGSGDDITLGVIYRADLNHAGVMADSFTVTK